MSNIIKRVSDFFVKPVEIKTDKTRIVAIELNDTIRDYLFSVQYVYNKYISKDLGTEDIDITKNPVTDFKLIDSFPFKNVDELNKFLYVDAPLEIFGHADELITGSVTALNKFAMDLKDFYGHELVIINKEAMKAIPGTLFFLSKIACRVNTIRFVQKDEEMWDNVDILITANPRVLKVKPKNKIAIKINTTYNKKAKADFEFNTFLELANNSEIQNKIVNNKKLN